MGQAFCDVAMDGDKAILRSKILRSFFYCTNSALGR